MTVCRDGCDVKMFCFSRANHASMNLKKVLSPYFGKYLFCKTKIDYTYKLRVQDFATGKNFSFNHAML